ncbi:hypothetical protein LRR18_16155 [Mangrovimonas sp. AS39]|uniref:hypothetical protein n=1 Tax=Mangrovimonas futianensis TaxID=2895523 RepID=UPI001E2926C6|nr:hypothetical protein [Mangrovimonas futianensis]MCF1193122.1 hypothetical protein [Mangrovimonas futianensis]MCF1196812.1 hypothetical protein [Mangrovimonas futianensis]
MQNDKLFYGKLFLISVSLLLVNDFYLKYQFHNYLTGKLSDFVGLFAFPYFVSLLFKSKVKTTYILTGILFIFWKSSSSQFAIDFLNNIGIGINRVVDYSDLIALLILPLSYRYRTKNTNGIKKINFIPKEFIVGICSFAFIATTLPKERGEINLKSTYETEFEMQKDSVLRKMFKYYQSDNDPKYQAVIELPEKRSRIIVSTIISETENDRTKIQLDSILFFVTEARGFFGVQKKNVDYVKELKLKDFEQLFTEQIINELNKK